MIPIFQNQCREGTCRQFHSLLLSNMSVDVHGCLDVFMSESFLIVAPASNKRETVGVSLNPCGVILLKFGYFLKHLKMNL